jgi:hypothetical protein
MLQVLKSKDFPYQSVLDLPFRAFHIVIGSHEQRNLQEEEVDWYNQVRAELCSVASVSMCISTSRALQL